MASNSIWHEQSAAATMAELGTSASGLSHAEAQARLVAHGPNRLPEPPRRSAFVRMLLHFHNVLIYVLLGAAVITRYVNGVAMRHGQISRSMFPGYPIASITNGVHAATWAAPAFQKIYDRHIPDWRQQNENLRYAVSIPGQELEAAHARLLAEVERRTGRRLSTAKLTLGFARRATPYKRADLLLADLERLRRIGGPIQIIYAGKAHPRDVAGMAMIRRVFERATELAGVIDVIYLEGYAMDLARIICAGVDLWVNTPRNGEQ